MALTYRNTQTGKVAHVPEAKEVEQARGRKRGLYARRTIEKMDSSAKWERLNGEQEVNDAEEAWTQRKTASRPSREASPTPVYVVNQAPQPTASDEEPERPPEHGPGSGRAAWVAYAESQGLDADDMSRDDIIEALR